MWTMAFSTANIYVCRYVYMLSYPAIGHIITSKYIMEWYPMVSHVATFSEKKVKEHMDTIICSFIAMGNPASFALAEKT